jgi:glycosyltransferase involved in cell wall biosynthesis
MPPVNWIGTVYHGLPAATCPFTPHPHGDYLAFLGRICPEKRVDRAIQIAKRAGVILKIAAKVDRIDATYFEEKICPLLDDPMVEFIGEITEVQKSDFLGNARALLFPIDWPEPFGLVMIEAMSSGTPVIAYRRGSVPEIIDHGLSGFIVNDEDEAVQAVRQVHSLDRRSVRKRFETRFSAERMAKEYLTIYHDMIRSVEETKRARWSSRMDAEVTES